MSIEKTGISCFKKVISTAEKTVPAEGYSRLKKIFCQGQNYKHYDQIVSTCKRPILGNIPDELIKIIVKTNPENKSTIIQGAQQSFEQAAETLKLCQIAKLDTIKNISGYEDEMKFLYDMLRHGTSTKIGQSKEELEIVQLAAKRLENQLNQFLKDAKVNISFAGEGLFKNCYKLQILNKNGQPIMHDRAFNIFKDINLSGEIAEAKYKKAHELLNKYSADDIKSWMAANNLKESAVFNVNYRLGLLKKATPQGKRDDLVSIISNALFTNGAYAEANFVTRLKNRLVSNISKSDLVDTDMFDLKSGFHIAQFSDDKLPEITHSINFEKLGLKADDIYADNIVNGRIIDFGDMLIDREILSDNTVLSWYKKIMNRVNLGERFAIIQRYKKLAKNPKTPLRDKIQTAALIAEADTIERFKALYFRQKRQ